MAGNSPINTPIRTAPNNVYTNTGIESDSDILTLEVLNNHSSANINITNMANIHESTT